MNIDKAKKRIAKRIKMGFQGYPQIAIAYFGPSKEFANEVVVQFTEEEGAEVMEERFVSKSNVQEDEVIQSAIVKMIERCDAKTVSLTEGIGLKAG